MSNNDAAADSRPRRGPRPLRDRQHAWNYLLNLLARQSYTVAELRTKLTRRGVAAPLAEELLARLEELELVNDETFASHYVATRRTVRGRLALRQELRRKGVAADIVEVRLGPLDDRQQLQAAVALLEKNAWRYRPGGNDAEAGTDPGADTDSDNDAADFAARHRAAARAKAFLARRGFTPDIVNSAVQNVGWFDE